MTVRVLVQAPHPTQGLAVAMQVTMDLYLRVPGDVVLVVPGGPTAGTAALEPLLGAAAERLAEGPQPFAGHTLRVVDAGTVGAESLEQALVVVHQATPAVIEAIERQVIGGLVVVPEAGSDLSAWGARTHADVVQARV